MLLIVKSFLLLLQIKFQLKKYNFNTLAKKYNLILQKDDIIHKDIDIKKVKTIGWAVERSALLLPWDGLCLVKALAAQQLLKKQNLSGTIFMGVKKDKEGKELEAHAWLKYNDTFLTGRAGHKEFTVVSRFTWSIN
ncbi:MAG: lasso peptide biosynthesis B2 protein [Halarcobacter sp.]